MDSPKPFHLIRSDDVRDDWREHELARLRAELEARDRQETAIAELGQAALTGVDSLILLGQACALVELTLQVSHVRALELTPGGRMAVRSALGANESFLRCAHDGEDDDSIGMVTLLAGTPLTFSKLEEETRFAATHLVRAHGVRSGAAVVIRTQDGPFGVLIAYAAEERTFADYELAFLRSTANIVGEAITRARTEDALRKSEKQLEYSAYYDSLTGLPNRLLFRDRLVHSLAHARRNRVAVAVMYLDLDHFKLVNDTLGHSFGDRLLADVATRLQGALRASDTISRIGGDEFSILLPEVVSTEAVAGVARKVLDSLSTPFRVEGHDLFVTASIGISCSPGDGDDAETLLKCADAAMYRAKELGRNQAQLFTASMNERYVRRLALEQHLHHAIERGQLDLWYQPVFDRARRRFVSVEALLRWRDPVRGLVPPSEFVGLAEETGMIVPIGAWALRTACMQLRQWQEEGLSLRMAVNISAVQLQQRELLDHVRGALEESGIAPEMLQLEITESAAMQNVELTLEMLRELRGMGVSVAVDDFGTGQSSLIYLKHFPIDTVKIDKEFLREVTSDDTAAAIVSYVINLAHTLRLQVVAEGVETEEQYTFLRHYACDLMQGYLFSRPLPAQEIVPFLRETLVKPRTLEIRRPGAGPGS